MPENNLLGNGIKIPPEVEAAVHVAEREEREKFQMVIDRLNESKTIGELKEKLEFIDACELKIDERFQALQESGNNIEAEKLKGLIEGLTAFRDLVDKHTIAADNSAPLLEGLNEAVAKSGILSEPLPSTEPKSTQVPSAPLSTTSGPTPEPTGAPVAPETSDPQPSPEPSVPPAPTAEPAQTSPPEPVPAATAPSAPPPSPPPAPVGGPPPAAESYLPRPDLDAADTPGTLMAAIRDGNVRQRLEHMTLRFNSNEFTARLSVAEREREASEYIATFPRDLQPHLSRVFGYASTSAVPSPGGNPRFEEERGLYIAKITGFGNLNSVADIDAMIEKADHVTEGGKTWSKSELKALRAEGETLLNTPGFLELPLAESAKRKEEFVAKLPKGLGFDKGISNWMGLTRDQERLETEKARDAVRAQAARGALTFSNEKVTNDAQFDAMLERVSPFRESDKDWTKESIKTVVDKARVQFRSDTFKAKPVEERHSEMKAFFDGGNLPHTLLIDKGVERTLGFVELQREYTAAVTPPPPTVPPVPEPPAPPAPAPTPTSPPEPTSEPGKRPLISPEELAERIRTKQEALGFTNCTTDEQFDAMIKRVKPFQEGGKTVTPEDLAQFTSYMREKVRSPKFNALSLEKQIVFMEEAEMKFPKTLAFGSSLMDLMGLKTIKATLEALRAAGTPQPPVGGPPPTPQPAPLLTPDAPAPVPAPAAPESRGGEMVDFRGVKTWDELRSRAQSILSLKKGRREIPMSEEIVLVSDALNSFKSPLFKIRLSDESKRHAAIEEVARFVADRPYDRGWHDAIWAILDNERIYIWETAKDLGGVLPSPGSPTPPVGGPPSGSAVAAPSVPPGAPVTGAPTRPPLPTGPIIEKNIGQRPPPIIENFEQLHPSEVLSHYINNVAGFSAFLASHPDGEAAFNDSRKSKELFDLYIDRADAARLMRDFYTADARSELGVTIPREQAEAHVDAYISRLAINDPVRLKALAAELREKVPKLEQTRGAIAEVRRRLSEYDPTLRASDEILSKAAGIKEKLGLALKAMERGEMPSLQWLWVGIEKVWYASREKKVRESFAALDPTSEEAKYYAAKIEYMTEERRKLEAMKFADLHLKKGRMPRAEEIETEIARLEAGITAEKAERKTNVDAKERHDWFVAARKSLVEKALSVSALGSLAENAVQEQVSRLVAGTMDSPESLNRVNDEFEKLRAAADEWGVKGVTPEDEKNMLKTLEAAARSLVALAAENAIQSTGGGALERVERAGKSLKNLLSHDHIGKLSKSQVKDLILKGLDDALAAKNIRAGDERRYLISLVIIKVANVF